MRRCDEIEPREARGVKADKEMTGETAGVSLGWTQGWGMRAIRLKLSGQQPIELGIIETEQVEVEGTAADPSFNPPGSSENNLDPNRPRISSYLSSRCHSSKLQ
jgi:hypothetical protein